MEQQRRPGIQKHLQLAMRDHLLDGIMIPIYTVRLNGDMSTKTVATCTVPESVRGEHESLIMSHYSACDARLSKAASACYDGAFIDGAGTNNGFVGGLIPFCDNFGLTDVQQKCLQVGCEVI